MSLLDENARTCVKLVETRTQGAEGGWTTTWADGEEITIYPALNTTGENQRGEQEGIASVFGGLVAQSVELPYNSYYRDTTTGETYRVTSNPDDKKTPTSATFSLKYFTAERKEPPT